MYLETNTYQIVSSFQQVRIPYKKAKRNGHPDVHINVCEKWWEIDENIGFGFKCDI